MKETGSTDVNNSEGTTLVFQYGSNCLDTQINGKDRLKGDARFISIAETVDDYELALNVFSNGRHCAAADIVPKPGSKAWGVLYEIPRYLISPDTAKERGRKSLDSIEGEGTNYKRQDVKLRTPDGTIVTALTYTVRDPRAGLKTSLDYVRYIIGGFRQRGIPGEYVEKVKSIAVANNAEIAEEVMRL
jgi:hypothetical protein